MLVARLVLPMAVPQDHPRLSGCLEFQNSLLELTAIAARPFCQLQPPALTSVPSLWQKVIVGIQPVIVGAEWMWASG